MQKRVPMTLWEGEGQKERLQEMSRVQQPRQLLQKKTTTPTQSKPSPNAIIPKKTVTPTTKTTKSEDSEKVHELQKQLEELQTATAAIQTDRDFYLGKLQKIEVICKEKEEEELAQDVLKVLYATAEDEEQVQEEHQEEVQEEPQEEESY